MTFYVRLSDGKLFRASFSDALAYRPIQIIPLRWWQRRNRVVDCGAKWYPSDDDELPLAIEL